MDEIIVLLKGGKQMFTLYETDHSPRDLETFYDVKFDKSYTVKEFVEAVLTKTRESGTIRPGRYDVICFNSGKITSSKSWEKLSSKVLNKKVVSAKAVSGWAGMRYDLVLNDEIHDFYSPEYDDSCLCEHPNTYLYKGVEKPLYKSNYVGKVVLDCLNCKNSFSLPAGDPFDDGSVSEEDRLVCVKDKTAKIVQDDGYCDYHSEND